jgi:fumarate hydratase subunit alpha
MNWLLLLCLISQRKKKIVKKVIIMRKVNVKSIENTVYEMFLSACVKPDKSLKEILEKAQASEENDTAISILSQLSKNIDVAAKNNVPLCQDTGMAVVFIDIGQEVFLEGGYVYDAINRGVRRAYEDGYFRKSVLSPLERVNTKDNTPAVIHTSIIPGDKIIINVAPKGFGSENMSKIKMLTPAEGLEGVVDFVRDTVKSAGGNPCPPICLGIGIGGTFELCALNAKRALMRELGQFSKDEKTAELEQRLLKEINSLNIGPMGMGGKTTALAVNIISAPTHLAGLPCAVNVQCHAARHERRVL